MHTSSGRVAGGHSLRVAALVACLGFLVLSMGGCALSTDSIHIAYTPQAGVQKIAGAQDVGVMVQVSDQREIKDKVSRKKNGYGMEMASIVADADVPTTVGSAIKAELANRGFKVDNGTVLVNVELNRFFNDFKVGFWAGDSVAEVVMNVQVKKPDGSIIYSKLVNGSGTEPNIQVAGGRNAEPALNAALNDAVVKLFGDSAFIDALGKANAK